MINKIINKYYTYQPGEFLPIRSGGVLLNHREFHLYKLTKALDKLVAIIDRLLLKAYAR